MQNRKKIPKQFKVSSATHLCSHITTLYKHLDYVKSFSPEYFCSHSDVETDGNVALGIEENLEDYTLTKSLPGSFNRETGLWEYKSLSTHKPFEMMDPDLISNTNVRNAIICDQKFNPSTGLYNTVDLKPTAFNPDGSAIPCECGSGYGSLGTYCNSGNATLYTRNGPVHCSYSDLKCGSGNCITKFDKEAQKKGIFFYSSQTCAGDEIGWDFISLVMKAKISFTAYCNEKTRWYTTSNTLAGHFMSPNTFICWFFGWLSAFKIDFRKEIDPWCEHDPEILACDGTHIGVSLRQMKLDKLVTRPDNNRVLKSKHKRGDRVLIKDKEAWRHLRYMCNKYLGKLCPDKILDYEEESVRSINLLNVVMRSGEPDIYNILECFLQQTQDKEYLHCLARVLHMLSGDNAMSSVALFPSHPTILLACQNMDNISSLYSYLEELTKYSIDIADLIHLSVKYKCTEITRNFLRVLIANIEEVHTPNRDAPISHEQPNTYNPPEGTAYYFTPHGNKLRDMPIYEVSGNSKKDNYDDNPEVDEPCKKYYPNVSFGGYDYMFLWFCLIHGHSYGFHLINSAEGRKDPFSSLFKYMKEPPKHIFYDNACQLSEYCLNREPDFFRNTQFWHDLFHSIGHKCGFNFKSGRIVGLQGVNSEICKQVNSFLQCIKYTASHLSQEHFMFFMQFFLYILNKNKTENFKKQATIAIAGHM